MKYPDFLYSVPGSLQEALETLEEDEESIPLAGGQSLLPLMAMRLSSPRHIVDLGGLRELAELESLDSRAIRIGAMVRQLECQRSPIVVSAVPVVCEAIGLIGHAAIRSRGTVGGSLALSDSAAELPTLMLALDAVLQARSASGQRSISARDFFQGHYLTALMPGELLVSVEIEVSDSAWVWSIEEVARRKGDFASVVAVVGVAIEDENRCSDVRISLGGVDTRPVRCTVAEDFLLESGLRESNLREAARLSSEAVSPPADIHGTSAYRKQLVGVLVERALGRSLDP